MKKIFLFLAAALMAGSLVSCKDDDNSNKNEDPILGKTRVAYVLNQGQSYNNIEGSFNLIPFIGEQSALNVFKTVNGRSIGNTPQCGVADEDYIYLGIFESNTIEILERDTYKSVKQIRLDQSGKPGTQPRSMVADNGKVYISMYDGYVARLDSKTLTIDASVKVGPNPEIMCLYNGKLYVPNSDGSNWQSGYGKTVSVVDVKSFQVTKTFETGLNPCECYATNKGVYVLCKGNYSMDPSTLIASKLYQITDNYESHEVAEATICCPAGNLLYFINQPFNGDGSATYSILKVTDNTVVDWNIARPDYANSIAYDKEANRIFIGSYIMDGKYPSYQAPGYVAVYNANTNELLHRYNVGVGPSAIFF